MAPLSKPACPPSLILCCCYDLGPAPCIRQSFLIAISYVQNCMSRWELDTQEGILYGTLVLKEILEVR
jgi:hypothetical protein